MRIRKQQGGFAAVELMIVVIIVAAIVVVGLWIYNKNNSGNGAASNTTPVSETQSPVAHNVSAAPRINSTGDLDKALQVLDENNPATANSSDSSQLNAQANF